MRNTRTSQAGGEGGEEERGEERGGVAFEAAFDVEAADVASAPSESVAGEEAASGKGQGEGEGKSERTRR